MLRSILAIAAVGSLSVSPQMAHAIPQCEGIDPTNVADVARCLSNVPQFEAMMPRITRSSSGCQFAKIAFRTGAGGRLRALPTCSIVAKAIVATNHPQPLWSPCADHYDLEADATPCLRVLADDIATQRGTRLDCAQAQTLMKSLGHTFLEAPAAASYEAPSCTLIDSALGSAQVRQEVQPAQAPGQAAAVVAASGGRDPEPRNLLGRQPEGAVGVSDVLYHYRATPNGTQLTIYANQIGACAGNMSVSVSIYSRDEPYSFTRAPNLYGDILSELRRRCGEVQNVEFTVDGRSPYAQPQNTKSFYRSTAANGWELESSHSPVDTPTVADATPFRLNLSTKDRSRSQLKAIFSGQLSVDTEARTAIAIVNTSTSPITLEGSFEPFERTDPGQAQRAIYTIRGEWQGNGDAGSKCYETRNGFAYWGTFTLTLDSRSSLRMETCPEKANQQWHRAFDYRIAWGDGSGRFTTEQELFARFDPPAGSVVAGDRELVAARSAAAREARIEAERRRIKPGLVYKPSQYWTDALGTYYLEHEIAATLKNVFDGVYEEIDYTEPHLRLIYYHYVLAYDAHCRDSIQDPVSKAFVAVETDQFGQVDRDESEPFWVEHKFEQRFDEYYTWNKKWIAGVMMAQAASGNIVQQGMNAATLHSSVMNRVVSTSECDTATMRQFQENLWRATHSRPSLQQSGESISGAEAETEVPEYLRE